MTRNEENDLAKIIKLLSLKGCLPILNKLYLGKMRFNELRTLIPNESTLSRRLNELKKYGLIGRKVLGNEVHRPTEYSLSERGRKLLAVLTYLSEDIIRRRRHSNHLDIEPL